MLGTIALDLRVVGATKNNKLIPTNVCLKKVFNYLIGLYVKHIHRAEDYRQYIKFVKDTIFWHNMVTSNDEAELASRKLLHKLVKSDICAFYELLNEQ